MAISIALCLVAGSLKHSLKPCCCASPACPAPGQLGAHRGCPASTGRLGAPAAAPSSHGACTVHPQLGFREAVYSLAQLKRELPLTFQGVGGFLLMASGWEWWTWLRCGLPMPRRCRELPVQAALLPSPQGMVVSMLLRCARGDAAAESCSLPRRCPAKIPLASRLEHCDQPSLGTGDG